MTDNDDTPAGLIDLCLGDEDGRQVYVYTHVPFERFAAYKTACLSGEPFDPADYGEIIASGEGLPPPHLVAQMQETYAFFDGFEDKMDALGHRIMAAQEA